MFYYILKNVKESTTDICIVISCDLNKKHGYNLDVILESCDYAKSTCVKWTQNELILRFIQFCPHQRFNSYVRKEYKTLVCSCNFHECTSFRSMVSTTPAAGTVCRDSSRPLITSRPPHHYLLCNQSRTLASTPLKRKRLREEMPRNITCFLPCAIRFDVIFTCRLPAEGWQQQVVLIELTTKIGPGFRSHDVSFEIFSRAVSTQRYTLSIKRTARLLEGIHFERLLLPEQSRLYSLQQGIQPRNHLISRNGVSFRVISTYKRDLVLLHFHWAQFYPHGHSSQFPVIEFPSGRSVAPEISLHPELTAFAQFID